VKERYVHMSRLRVSLKYGEPRAREIIKEIRVKRGFNAQRDNDTMQAFLLGEIGTPFSC
jgi:hypothetical protein